MTVVLYTFYNNNNKLIYIAPKGRNFRGAGGNVMRSDVYTTVEDKRKSKFLAEMRNALLGT